MKQKDFAYLLIGLIWSISSLTPIYSQAGSTAARCAAVYGDELRLVNQINNTFSSRLFWGLSSMRSMNRRIQQEYEGQGVYEMLKNDQYDFAIHAKSKNRLAILNEGFKTSHETGNSYREDPNYVRFRDRLEAGFLSMSSNEYRNINPAEKPKYGLLRPKLESGIQPHYARQYGSDVWVFKKDLIRDRTTFTLGDSVNMAHPLSYVLSIIRKRYQRLGMAGLERETFLPWDSANSLLVPSLQRQVSTSNTLELGPVFGSRLMRRAYAMFIDKIHQGLIVTETPKDAEYLQRRLGKIMETPTRREYPVRDVLPVHKEDGEYVELQYWGRLDSPRYIEALIYHKDPPTPQEMRILEEHGIKVYDGRNFPEAHQ